MAGNIFVIQDDHSLVPMQETPYDSEDLLQALLEQYPDVLAGDQLGTEARRWVLVSREFGVPGEHDGSDRWSLDHLFLDQDGTPTLVEVKRSSDTRLRREVVGQLLDYAANGIAYWPEGSIRSGFEDACTQREEDPALVIANLLDNDGESEESVERFWDRVEQNLRGGNVRLVFVADVIPAELRRIVEFLNEQMTPAEVLAVEIRQFTGGNLRTLVPRVYGQTTKAERVKVTGRSKPGLRWTEETFFTELSGHVGERELAFVRKVYEWSQAYMPDIFFGSGKTRGSFFPGLSHQDADGKRRWYQLLGFWTNGSVEFQFEYTKSKPRFRTEDARRDILSRFNEIPSVELSADAIDRRPWMYLKDVKELDGLLDVLSWFVKEVHAS